VRQHLDIARSCVRPINRRAGSTGAHGGAALPSCTDTVRAPWVGSSRLKGIGPNLPKAAGLQLPGARLERCTGAVAADGRAIPIVTRHSRVDA